MKTVIIGDVHGCVESRTIILNIFSISNTASRLILLGDLFDRGPDSWEVFQTVKHLQETYQDHFVLLRGNHEDYLLQEKLPFSMELVWNRVGKQATVKSFKKHNEKMKDAAPWIAEHSVLYYKGEDFQCVHAGIKIDPPELNDTYTLIHDHDVVKQNRYKGPLTITGHIALEEPTYFAGAGETPQILPYNTRMPLPEKGIICIDTGCGKGGKLTAMVIEDGYYTLYCAPQ